MLPQIDVGGQERLLDSRVLIIGLGGLGSPVAMYLAAAGVGHLVLVDFDKVDLSNLQRQIIHGTNRIGQAKVDSARRTLHELNDDVRVDCIEHRLEAAELREEVSRAGLVIDASDNFETRFAINAACVQTRTPLVSGAAIRMEGQVAVFSGQPGGPCYQCLYPPDGQVDETCSANGVLAPMVGIVGSIQANEAIKVLVGTGTSLAGRLLMIDALHMQWRDLRLKADPQCSVCSGPLSD